MNSTYRTKWLSKSAQASGIAMVVATMAPGHAVAQAADAPAEAEAPTSDIVVTGSRVSRKGFEQPTPMTVLGQDVLQTRAPATIADALNQLPSVAGSVSPRSINNNTTGGTAGANLLNLRNLGVNRTLVLLDGHRVAPSTVTGAVDINLLPASLVQRVELVTGGASAAYGSDAVAGVVNFVLDDRFTGVKGTLETGITEEGDARSYKASMAYGGSFLDNRLRVLLSGSLEDIGDASPVSSRSWSKGYKIVANPAFVTGNGQAPLTILPNVGTANATAGGLITAGPLRGTQFLPGGTPAPFSFGSVTGQLSAGGSAVDDAQYNQLQAPLNNKTAYGHIAFDLSDNVTLYGEAGYGRSTTSYYTVPFFKLNSITIQSDNAYLDPVTKARMATAGVTSFTMGRTNRDLGSVQGFNQRELTRFVGGAKGTLAGVKWDVYYQHGDSKIINRLDNDAIGANYTLAVDAVRNGSGQIVCRSTLTNPTNGCVPLNVFGDGSPSAAAADYVNGTGLAVIRIKQDVAAASVSAEPFSLWAGPVSVAAGGEYRRDSYTATADALSTANAFFVGNYKPSGGSVNVKEAFFETVIPLLRDLPFAKSVDFNGAVRVTDYSTSGTVTTWKLGATWDVNSDLRFRGTRSRDIRAPNLNDLFQGGLSTTVTVADSLTGANYFTQKLTVGNRSLKPEKADTYTVGAVYRPGWAPGLSASVDYFNIKITDAIVTLEAQDLLNRCLAGNTALCQYVIRNGAGAITQIQTPGLNASSEKTDGIDIELSYRTALSRLSSGLGGNITLSALGTWVDKRTVTLGAVTTDYAGALSDATAVPDWRWLLSASYDNGPWSTTLTGRYIGSGVISNAYKNNGITDNHVPATLYVDLAASVDIHVGSKGKVQLFWAVDNLLNQDPRVTPATFGNTFAFTGTNQVIYDVLGRAFRTGVRFKF
ncbi:MAG: TonB-dependent receptor [Sphingomonas sp.]|jgi:outer membrane receptor protein involved in Fe transport|uniref:TonB-dependent receptor plug domain-containing protein n=1 Tax=Sphingomonas sp. TaxID=28214 RepID=UPI0035658EFD